jgi:hypothetical protein
VDTIAAYFVSKNVSKNNAQNIQIINFKYASILNKFRVPKANIVKFALKIVISSSLVVIFAQVIAIHVLEGHFIFLAKSNVKKF